MDQQAFAYIMASQCNGTLYTGINSNLVRCVPEHKTQAHPDSYTARHGVHMRVWHLAGPDIGAAIALEKKIKNRTRASKVALIERTNPAWRDLSSDFLDSATDARNDEEAA